MAKPTHPHPRVYRAFHIAPSGVVDGPTSFIEAVDDDSALQHAKRLVDGRTVELWDRGRLVARLEPGPEAPNSA